MGNLPVKVGLIWWSLGFIPVIILYLILYSLTKLAIIECKRLQTYKRGYVIDLSNLRL